VDEEPAVKKLAIVPPTLESASTVAASLQRKLHRRSLADQVADSLRSLILSGRLAPDTPVTQAEVARLLGVSTMPVREALLRLTAEGFLKGAPNRSFTVRRLTEDDIRDIYWTHSVLIGELTRRACIRDEGLLHEQLSECETAFAQARRRRDSEGMNAANLRFHQTINKTAHAPRLVMFLESAIRYIPMEFYALIPKWPEESLRGHAEILQAVRCRDPDAAGRAAESHVRIAGELLISSFWTNHAWATPAQPK
jgi:DNA-binding GntR family transcriptional regulator